MEDKVEITIGRFVELIRKETRIDMLAEYIAGESYLDAKKVREILGMKEGAHDN